jgi:hypothetical protein
MGREGHVLGVLAQQPAEVEVEIQVGIQGKNQYIRI